MDESLFTTRQLTEYREWPDGRKGCLFYIEGGSGSICILDTPLRKLDKLKLFKKLSTQEVMSSFQNEPVVSGFGALLFKLMITTKPLLLDYEELWTKRSSFMLHLSVTYLRSTDGVPESFLSL